MVSQDVILFDDTVKNNISYAKENASDEEINQACKFAAADEFINKLPNKYNTIIGENGVRLSSDKNKEYRLRAILKESPIILLDEATSSLDAESEEIVQNASLNLTKIRLPL